MCFEKCKKLSFVYLHKESFVIYYRQHLNATKHSLKRRIGMAFNREEFRNKFFDWDKENIALDVVTRDSLILERVFAECPIGGRPNNTFFYDSGVFLMDGLVFRRRQPRNEEIARLSGLEDIKNYESRGYIGFLDFGHTAPDYKNVFGLGLSGILE